MFFALLQTHCSTLTVGQSHSRYLSPLVAMVTNHISGVYIFRYVYSVAVHIFREGMKFRICCVSFTIAKWWFIYLYIAASYFMT